jgi:hypothetical protein
VASVFPLLAFDRPADARVTITIVPIKDRNIVNTFDGLHCGRSSAIERYDIP